MRLLAAHQIPPALEGLCRQSRLVPGALLAGMLVSTVFLAAIAVGTGLYWAILPFAGLCLLVDLLLLIAFRAALLPSNWVVGRDSSGLFLQFRSYLNHGFPAEDPVAVAIPFRHAPLDLAAPGLIRLHWRGKGSHVVPAVENFLAGFDRRIEVEAGKVL